MEIVGSSPRITSSLDRRRGRFVAALLVGLAPGSIASQGDIPSECRTFTWDLSREINLLATATETVALAADVATAPELEVGVAYRLTLPPATEGAEGRTGVARLPVLRGGRHRISASGLYRIDLYDGATELPAVAFQGSPACPHLRKSLAYELPAGGALRLVLQQVPATSTRLVVTRLPVETAR
jgi:hypothetical protein